MESGLKQCTVVLTRACNLRCEFCYVKSAGYSESDLIEFDKLKEIIDFCSDANVKYVFFTGGEPLIYPYLIDILKYIKTKPTTIVPTIATNGVLLQDIKLCKILIENGIEYIDISIKGNNSKEWLETTGYDGVEAQAKAIRNLANMSIPFTCSMVLTPDSVHSLCEAVDNAKKYGAKQFSFTFVIDNNNTSDRDYEYLRSHNPVKLINDFISQMDKLNEITEEWWIEYSFPMCMYTGEQLEKLKGRLASPCQIHMKNAVTFNTQMELLPCDMYIQKKLGRLGKDFSTYKEFLEFSKKESYKSIMGKIRELPSEDCLNCDYLEKCYGGCPVLWKNYSFSSLKKFMKDLSN